MSHKSIYNRLRRRVRGWNKADLINHLGAVHGYRNYLEICNAISGYLFALVDPEIYPIRHRMGYRSPTEFHDDGGGFDFRTESLDSSGVIREVRAGGIVYDVILVDSWHEYDTTYRDLTDALSLLSERGTIVVHDCFPENEQLTRIPFTGGEWNGVSYRAFLDFANQHGLEYRVVEADFGCGIIRKGIPAPPPSAARDALLDAWAAVGDDNSAAFRFLHQHKDLWNVIPVSRFLDEEAQRARHRERGRQLGRQVA